MSRHGYCDNLDPLALGAWRGMVASATRGKRGQKLLRDLLAALDAMPEKRLVARTFGGANGEVCALGCVMRHRGLPVPTAVDDELEGFREPVVDGYEFDDCEAGDYASAKLDIAECLAREIMFENDDGGRYQETPEERWARVRRWAERRARP